MFRIAIFGLIAWLLASCAPGAIDVQVAPASQVSQQDAALAGLRPVVKAMLSGEVDARVSLVQFLKTTCTTRDGLGGPPKCPAGLPEGSEVEVLPLGESEGSFATRAQVNQVMEIAIHQLYAIYRVPANPRAEPERPEGEYALIFQREMNDYPMPVTLRVADGKIVRVDHAMGRAPASLLEGIPTGNILLPPDAAAGWVKEFFPPAENQGQ